MSLADNESKNKLIAERIKIDSQRKLVKKAKIIIIIAIIILIVLLPVIIKHHTIENGKEKPNDPKNGPAAANGFTPGKRSAMAAKSLFTSSVLK